MDVTSQTNEAATLDATDVVALARRLVDVPSVTGSEASIGALLLDVLGGLGFDARPQAVEGDRFNVHTLTDETRVVLCTHMDTVGPHFGSSEDDTTLFGRGACDAKGILAAMIVALRGLRDRGERRVGLLALVGEEVDSIGARAAGALARSTTHVVVGEPTEGRMAVGHKGALAVTLRAGGRAAHSGYPELGSSAVHTLLDALADVRSASWGADRLLGDATVNVGTIEGGVASNVLAPSAGARLMIRLVGPSRDARARMAEILERHPDVEAVDLTASDPVRCLTLDGFSTEPVSFGSDLPWLEAFGDRLLFGPGSIRHAHTSEERIEKRALVEAVAAYRSIATRLLS